MKKKLYIQLILILSSFITGCTNKVDNGFNDFKYKTKPKDSLTFNEFKRIIRTANDKDFIELGKFGNIGMPGYYSVHKSSIRHLGGDYYGAVVTMQTNPIHSAEYIEFHPINQNSIIQVFSGGAGRSSQFSNWSYEEVNENLAIDETPYFKSLVSVLKTNKSDYTGTITEISCDLIDDYNNSYHEGRTCYFSYYGDSLNVVVDVNALNGIYIGRDNCYYKSRDTNNCFFLALEGDDNPYENEYLKKVFWNH